MAAAPRSSARRQSVTNRGGPQGISKGARKGIRKGVRKGIHNIYKTLNYKPPKPILNYMKYIVYMIYKQI